VKSSHSVTGGARGSGCKRSLKEKNETDHLRQIPVCQLDASEPESEVSLSGCSGQQGCIAAALQPKCEWIAKQDVPRAGFHHDTVAICARSIHPARILRTTTKRNCHAPLRPPILGLNCSTSFIAASPRCALAPHLLQSRHLILSNRCCYHDGRHHSLIRLHPPPPLAVVSFDSAPALVIVGSSMSFSKAAPLSRAFSTCCIV
jgi:hypothetical protein